MSDYVNTTDQASLDNSAMDLVPFKLDFDLPTMPDHQDQFDWDNSNYDALVNVDWTQLQDEIMQEVFLDPAVLLPGPGDREHDIQWRIAIKSPQDSGSGPISREPHRDQSHVFSPAMQATTGPPSAENDQHFVCEVEGCGAGPYKQRGSLTRHSKKHIAQQLYECPAIGCVRIGRSGFTRKDKLVDHMLAGHDEESPFKCSICGGNFPRDIFAVHVNPSGPLYWLSAYRTCPLPRCSHKVNVYPGSPGLHTNLKKLQHHLGEKHDLNTRIHYTNLLEQRGYDARTCEVVCPVCPSRCCFPGHVEFATHFKQVHLGGEYSWNYGSVPDEVRQARHTILRIWPELLNH